MRIYKVGRTYYLDPGRYGPRQTLATDNQAEARERAKAICAKLWERAALGAQHMTWDAAVNARLDETEAHRDVNNVKDKLRWLTNHLRGTWLRDIRVSTVEDLIEKLSAEPTPRGTKREPGTVNRYTAELSAVLHLAWRREWIDSVPYIRKLDEGDGVVRWLRPTEARDLLAELPPHLNMMAGFTLEVGLRDYNVTHLTWQNINMDTRTAWIDAANFKTGVAHRIPLTDGAMAILRAQSGLHPEWVFPYDGRPVNKCSNHAWYKAMARASIENFRWHDLRHTWASWYVQRGGSLHDLMKLGGWKSYEMVLRYAHFEPQHAQIPHTPRTASHENHTQVIDSMGWLTGLEPATTGITIQDSTN